MIDYPPQPATDGGGQSLKPAPERFLIGLGEGLSVAGAAKLAGVGRQTVYDWRKRDAAFAAAWDDAIETGTDNLEDEARRSRVVERFLDELNAQTTATAGKGS